MMKMSAENLFFQKEKWKPSLLLETPGGLSVLLNVSPMDRANASTLSCQQKKTCEQQRWVASSLCESEL
jgi:hypothetical protein